MVVARAAGRAIGQSPPFIRQALVRARDSGRGDARRLILEVLQLAYLFLPLMGGALTVAICTRNRWVSVLAIPVDRGAKLRGRRLFGDSKTVRGLLAGALGTAMAMALQARWLHRFPAARALEYRDYGHLAPWRFGFLLGLVRMLCELPNSVAKRQLDIPPGELGHGGWGAVFFVVDRLDYLPGTWIVFASLVPVTLPRVLLSIVLVVVAHHLTILAGYGLGLRQSRH